LTKRYPVIKKLELLRRLREQNENHARKRLQDHVAA
jgi:hypothetical protein